MPLDPTTAASPSSPGHWVTLKATDSPRDGNTTRHAVAHAARKQANKLASWFTTDQGSERQGEARRTPVNLGRLAQNGKNPIYSLTRAQKCQDTNVFFPDTAGSRATEVDGNDRIGKRRNRKRNCSWAQKVPFILHLNQKRYGIMKTILQLNMAAKVDERSWWLCTNDWAVIW